MTRTDDVTLLSQRRALLAVPMLAMLAACQAPPTLVVVTSQAGGPGMLGAQLTSTLPPAVPLQTSLTLSYGAAVSGYGSLYTVASSGQVMRLFENRPLRPGAMIQFPAPSEPVFRFGAPAGTEQFVLTVSTQPLGWLTTADYADQTAFSRLNLDRMTFEGRLSSALASLPVGSWQAQRLNITTF